MAKLYELDATYKPFTVTRLIMERFADFNMEVLRQMTGSDMWGLYIKRNEPLSYDVLYNGYVDTVDGDKFRQDIWDDFNFLTNRVLVGDTVVVMMYKTNGFSIHLKREEANKWSYKFFHHPKYGCDFPNKKPDNFVAGEGISKIEINCANLQSIKGYLTTLNGSSIPRQTLEVKLDNNSIIILHLEPCNNQGSINAKNEMLYNAIIDLYEPAVVEGRDVWIQSAQKKKVLGDWTLGWKFLQWLDKASMWKKCWGGGLTIA